MIDKLLSGAVKLYLRSQVDRVENLQVKIVGKNKQILQGCIPEVRLNCDRAIYQGLHLNQIELKGADIAFNLPEVTRKQPLRLIKPIWIEVQLKLDAADLQASLDSSLLQSGLSDLWQMILSRQNYPELTGLKMAWQKVAIVNRTFNLSSVYRGASDEQNHLALTTEINLANPHTLCLSPLEITRDANRENIGELELDLGKDVYLKELAIESQQIICSGIIKVNS